MYEELSPGAALIWDQALLAPVIEINERLLERLHAQACARQAARGHECATSEAPELVQALLLEWCELDAAAQRRLAQCPYLLLDAGFAEPARWQAVVGGLAVHEDGPERRERAPLVADPSWVALRRRTLLLGWHLARAQPLAARVLLGMSPASAECIAARRLTELEELAEGAGRMAPRWERQPQVWRQLLRASRAAGEQLRWTQLRGLQLLAGEAGMPGLTGMSVACARGAIA
ncbi:MAG TPA: hypothetical protein VHY19_08265 [Steroidobacteraceae bacterium]|jgi:hypothetical protein|nr:hypothetical protein [Steroidobacteraceae bacterium]